MRLPIILILNALVCVVAGALLAIAFDQTSVAMTVLFVSGGVLTFFGVTVCSWMFIQGAHDRAFGQLSDSNREQFDKTLIHEFNTLTSIAAELKQAARTRESQIEGEIAIAVAATRDQIPPQQQAEPQIEEELRRIQGFLSSMDGFSTVSSTGDTLTCLEQLQQVLKRLQSNVGSDMSQLLGCGLEIYQATEELVDGTETQFSVAEETNGLIDQLVDRVGNVYGHAVQTREACKTARSASEKNLTKVATLADDVKELRQQSTLREGKLQDLIGRAREVETIVQTIGNRSPQHIQAVTDITSRLELIQLDASQALSMTGAEQTQLLSVVEQVSNSLEVIEDTCKASAVLSEGLDAIASNSDEQLKITQEIGAILEKTAEITILNRDRAEGANCKARSFDELSAKVESTLTRFSGGPAITSQGELTTTADRRSS